MSSSGKSILARFILSTWSARTIPIGESREENCHRTTVVHSLYDGRDYRKCRDDKDFFLNKIEPNYSPPSNRNILIFTVIWNWRFPLHSGENRRCDSSFNAVYLLIFTYNRLGAALEQIPELSISGGQSSICPEFIHRGAFLGFFIHITAVAWILPMFAPLFYLFSPSLLSPSPHTHQ